MRKLFLITFLALISCQTAFAEMFSTGPLHEGLIKLGIEPEFTLDPVKSAIFFHATYDLDPNTSFFFKTGLGEANFSDGYFVGGGADFRITPDKKGSPGMFVRVGLNNGINTGKLGFDFSVNLHNNFGTVTPYLALDADYVILEQKGKYDSELPSQLIFGIKMPIKKNMEGFFEVGIELIDSASFISGGVSFIL